MSAMPERKIDVPEVTGGRGQIVTRPSASDPDWLTVTLLGHRFFVLDNKPVFPAYGSVRWQAGPDGALTLAEPFRLEWYAYEYIAGCEPQELKDLHAKIETPHWEPFRGNNHAEVPDHGCQRGGIVSFARHLGQPLSRSLWIDLTLRLRVRSLRIYDKDHQAMWLDAPSHMAYIHLDAADRITDIGYAP